MAKPYIHSLSSSKKFGGTWEDYIHIHTFMDSSKACIADNRHRILTHNSWFIGTILPEIYGETFQRKSDNKIISTRDIGEQHISEDFGMKFIPSLDDYLNLIPKNFELKVIDLQNRLEKAIKYAEETLDMMSTEFKLNIHKPKAVTTNINYLLMTCSNWWFERILGNLNMRAYELSKTIEPFPITELLNNMEYKEWLQNGHGNPPSQAQILKYRENKTYKVMD